MEKKKVTLQISACNNTRPAPGTDGKHISLEIIDKKNRLLLVSMNISCEEFTKLTMFRNEIELEAEVNLSC